MSEKVIFEGITQAMIDAAVERFGKEKVKVAQLPKDDDGIDVLNVLIAVPNRTVINEFSKWIDRNPGKANDILINQCLLSSKDAVKADDGLYYAAVDAISQLLVVRKAVIKNL